MPEGSLVCGFIQSNSFYTMNMSFSIFRAFPCWDEPAVKATFGVTLIIPAHLTALSNMPEVSTAHLPSSGGKQLKKVVFEDSPKMSTYLLAWAVGEFDFVQGVTKGGVMLRVFSPPGRGPQGQFALDVGIRSLDFYDEYFQVLCLDLLSLSRLIRIYVFLGCPNECRWLTLCPSWT